MKKLVLICLAVACTAVAPAGLEAQACRDYANIVNNIRLELAKENPDFEAALADVESLRACRPLDQTEAKQFQDIIFDRIEEQRDDAVVSERRASESEKKATKSAAAERVAADRASRMQKLAEAKSDSVAQAKKKIDKLLRKQQVAYRKSLIRNLSLRSQTLSEEDFTHALNAAYEAYNSQPGEETAAELRSLLGRKNTLVYASTLRHLKPFYQMELSPDGSYLATLSTEGLTLWTSDGKKLRSFGKKSPRVSNDAKEDQILFANDSKTLYWVDYNNRKITWWAVPDAKGSGGEISLPDAAYRCFPGEGNSIHTTDTSRYQIYTFRPGAGFRKTADFSAKKEGVIQSISPDGSAVVLGDALNTLSVYSLDGSKKLAGSRPVPAEDPSRTYYNYNSNNIGSLCASEKAGFIAVATGSQIVVLMPVADTLLPFPVLTAVSRRSEYSTPSENNFFFINDTTLLYSAGNVRILTVNRNNRRDEDRYYYDSGYGETFAFLPGYHRQVEFSPVNNLLLTSDGEGNIKVWRYPSHFEVELDSTTRQARFLQFSPNGNLLAVADKNGRIGLFDRSGKKLRAFPEPVKNLSALAFYNDRTLMLLGGEKNGAILLMDTSGKVEALQAEGLPEASLLAVHAPSGRIAIAGNQGMIVIFEDKKQPLPIQTDMDLSCIAFSPDGTFIAVGGTNGNVKSWRIDGTNEMTYTGHTAVVKSVAISPDNRLLFSGSYDYTARLWRMDSGKQENSFDHKGLAVFSTAFSPDGRYIATSDSYGNLWIGDELQNSVFNNASDNTDYYYGYYNQPDVDSFSVRENPLPIVFSPDGSVVARGGYREKGAAKLVLTPDAIFSGGFLDTIDLMSKLRYGFDVAGREAMPLLADSTLSADDLFYAADTYLAERYDLFEDPDDLKLLKALYERWIDHPDMTGSTVEAIEEQMRIFREKAEQTELNDSLLMLYRDLSERMGSLVGDIALNAQQSPETLLNWAKYFGEQYLATKDPHNLDLMETKYGQIKAARMRGNLSFFDGEIQYWRAVTASLRYNNDGLPEPLLERYNRILENDFDTIYYREATKPNVSPDDILTACFWFAGRYRLSHKDVHFRYVDSLLTLYEYELTLEYPGREVTYYFSRASELSSLSDLEKNPEIKARYEALALRLRTWFKHRIDDIKDWNTLTELMNAYDELASPDSPSGEEFRQLLYAARDRWEQVAMTGSVSPEVFRYQLQTLEMLGAGAHNPDFFQDLVERLKQREREISLNGNDYTSIRRWAEYFSYGYRYGNSRDDLEAAVQMWGKLKNPALLDTLRMDTLVQFKTWLSGKPECFSDGLLTDTWAQLKTAVDNNYHARLDKADGIDLIVVFNTQAEMKGYNFDMARMLEAKDMIVDLVGLGERALKSANKLHNPSNEDSLLINQHYGKLIQLYSLYCLICWKESKYTEAIKIVDRMTKLAGGEGKNSGVNVLAFVSYILNGQEKKADRIYKKSLNSFGRMESFMASIERDIVQLTDKQKKLFQKYIDLENSSKDNPLDRD